MGGASGGAWWGEPRNLRRGCDRDARPAEVRAGELLGGTERGLGSSRRNVKLSRRNYARFIKPRPWFIASKFRGETVRGR